MTTIMWLHRVTEDIKQAQEQATAAAIAQLKLANQVGADTPDAALRWLPMLLHLEGQPLESPLMDNW